MSGARLRSQVEMHALAEQMVRGEISADAYFAIVDEQAKRLVDRFVDLLPGWPR